MLVYLEAATKMVVVHCKLRSAHTTWGSHATKTSSCDGHSSNELCIGRTLAQSTALGMLIVGLNFTVGIATVPAVPFTPERLP